MGGASFFEEDDRFVLEALRQWTGRQAAGGGPAMDADRAQALAETLHCGQRDACGAPLLDHIRRVAAAVPADARALAWLHEALEHTPVSAEALLAEGLSLDELSGLRLLTRDKSSRSKARYLAHVKLIARARGAGASLARSVKRADLADRALNPAVRSDGWSPPYETALEILLGAPRPNTRVLRPRRTRGSGPHDLPDYGDDRHVGAGASLGA